MHAASVNPEPGSNSLNNCIISPMQTISLPQSHYLSIQSFASSNSSNYSLKFVLFKVFLTDFLALIQCFFSEISVVQFSRNKHRKSKRYFRDSLLILSQRKPDVNSIFKIICGFCKKYSRGGRKVVITSPGASNNI